MDAHAFRPALLRSLRTVAWLVTWPPWKLAEARMRRDPRMAAGFYDKLIAGYSRKLGPYHRTTLHAQANHAVALSKQGEFQQAEAELAEVIIRLDPLDDGDAPLLLEVRRWHHFVLLELGSISESEADARFVAESYARQLGPDHPDTLKWRQLNAVALWEVGRHDEATAEMADVAARRAATQGAAHADALQAERILSSMRTNEHGSFGIRLSAE
jgi:hypothetical protein